MNTAGDRWRIGFVADTHDVDNPEGVIRRLAERGCDYNVHLGDIGGSRMVMNVVRDFKRHMGDVAHLPAEQRRRFQAAVDSGISPLRAYVETRVGTETIPLRLAETTAAYRAIIRGMAPLSNPILLRGNVDGMQLRSPAVAACFEEGPLSLTTRPRMIDLGWLGIIAWPSWRPANTAEQVELGQITEAIASAAQSKSHLVVCAHEQLFKGPVAEVYAARVAAAGLQQRSIPRFDPNPTWRCLLHLLRQLPVAVRCYYVFGHVHDGADVMRAGTPALRDPNGPGLRYRLYGLAAKARVAGKERRAITLLPVAINDVAVLGVSRDGDQISWEVRQYE